MRAIYAGSASMEDPLSALVVGERPEPEIEEGWVRVQVQAAGLNHHDIWSLRGVGLPSDRLPMILGCDAAGLDEQGNPVIVHSVINGTSLLSEKYQGTFAEYVAVPKENLIPLPSFLSIEQAACLPVAWLTGYRMLFGHGALNEGDTVLIQGASGGVSTAMISMARAGGLNVWVTSRSPQKREEALALGAHQVFESGARLPDRVDAVMETVGKATWSHSIRSVKFGGSIIVSGATTGDAEPAHLQHIFARELRIKGSSMGSQSDFIAMLSMMERTGVRPVIHRAFEYGDGRAAFEEMLADRQFGKILITF